MTDWGHTSLCGGNRCDGNRPCTPPLRPGKSREDYMPRDQRPRVKAAQARLGRGVGFFPGYTERGAA